MSEPNPRYILPQVESADMLHELLRRMEEVSRLLREGLETDGAQHKQWYLWMIAETLQADLSGIDVAELEKGIAP